jgi:hypothetical protein
MALPALPNLLAMTRTPLALKIGALAAISFGGLLAGEAHAANPCFLSALAGNSAACDFSISYFQISSVSYTGFTPGSFDYLSYTLSGEDFQPQLSFLPGRTKNINGTLTYTLTLLNGRTFTGAQANITGNNGTFATSTTSTGLPTAATSTGGPGTTVSLNPALTAQTFTQTFSARKNGSLVLNSLGTIYSTTAPAPTPPVETPGPLPILGAGAAFGFSRRLRHRIKLSA